MKIRSSFTTLALVLLFWPLISRAIAILRGRNGRPPSSVE